jgi:diguanylate cyclase (GGDEF)-like protein/PAS domain S-box-containing protein
VPTLTPDSGEHWLRHHHRVRQLQRWQLVALSIVCLGSIALTVVLGRALLGQFERQATADMQNRELLSLSNLMRTTEVDLWRATAEGRDLPFGEFTESFTTFQRGVAQLAAEDAGGNSPAVAAARARVVESIRQVNEVAAKAVLDGKPASAIPNTDAARVGLTEGMRAWVAGATAEGRRAEAASRRLSRRLIYGALGLMSLLGIASLLLWIASERSRGRLGDAIMASEERFRSLVQNSSDAVLVVDGGGVIRYAARSVQRLLGYPPHELVGRPFAELVALGADVPFSLVVERGIGVIPTDEPLIWQAVHHDGSVRQLESIATDRLDDHAVRGMIVNSRDVTDRHEMEQKLAHRAFHDPLTELANRTLFEDRVEHALRLSRRGNRLVAVMLIDLDDFKTVNDSLGHAAGDALIVEMARRIRTSLRAGDTAARLGGDEFVILFETATDRVEVERLAARLVGVISRPTVVEGHELVVQASMGIAYADRSDDTAASLLRDADVAMYTAKDRGRAGYVIFDPSMTQRVTDRLGLVADLHRAIERDELWIAYQPIVAIEGRTIRGVEALVRWKHPTRGQIEPNAFIPLAEETGQINTIGLWVLRTALREISSVACAASELMVSVNVSTRQLEQETFADQIAQVLAEADFRPESLTLEITESALMRDPETLLRQLELIKRLGVTIAIDDFGTGYSSLAYLARLPIDLVKIDRSFISGVASPSRDSRIAQMIMGIGASLSLRTVAEGVEQQRQLDALVVLGCELAQGYLFSPAVPIDRLCALVSDGLPAQA